MTLSLQTYLKGMYMHLNAKDLPEGIGIPTLTAQKYNGTEVKISTQ